MKSIKNIFLKSILLLLIARFISAGKTGHPINNIFLAAVTTDTTFRTFSVSKNKFGFDILIDKKAVIHQPFIPAVAGNNGFSKRSDAEKVATLMISKLKKFGMPPTITTEDLDSLHISYPK